MKDAQEVEPTITYEGWVSGKETIRDAATAVRAAHVEDLISKGHDFGETIYD